MVFIDFKLIAMHLSRIDENMTKYTAHTIVSWSHREQW